MTSSALALLLLAAAGPPADLTTTIDLGPRIGAAQQATVTVRNAGPGDAPGVQLALRVGEGSRLVSAAASPGACRGAACELGGLAAGAVSTIVLVVSAPAEQPLALGAAATSQTGDPTPADAAVSVERPAVPGVERPAVPGIVMQASRLRAAVTTPHTLLAGSRVRVAGRLLADAPLAGERVTVSVASRWWPGLVRTTSAATDASGRFEASVAPIASGEIVVRFEGSARLARSSTVAGDVALRPRVAARFTGLGPHRGTFATIRAAGRFTPALAGEGARLAWQALRGGRWMRIGSESDDVRVHRGRLLGELRLGALRAQNRYRLVYEPLGRAPLTRGTSAALTAVAR
jgi:hypothetical protein